MATIYIAGHEGLHELHSMRKSVDRVLLTRGALSRFILRFLEEDITAAQLQAFADELEGEPIEYEDELDDGVIPQVLFEMSEPEANGPIDRTAAEKWLGLLRI